MNHKMTTTTPFILLGFDADSFHNDKLMNMFRERGYNILFNSDESHFSSAWYAFHRNKKPTIVVNVFTDEERLKYQNLPAIIVRDDLPFEVRSGDIDLGSFVTVYELDEAMFNYGKETAQEAPEEDEQDEDDDDYAPICFSSQNGFYGYDEGLDTL
ncbi:hypothetical protein AACJ57_004440 [Escherichia coli]|uniref:hypothetical protein n=1 Tax=Escherichia coli TaxID=562 RepID=UPI000BB89103|nr:hypothetical protein [Escherichia coli]EFI4252488.1 hypothetical protein [Escherichia coli]EIY5900346.1 hypothetical protein [Escherichia coli]EJM1704589.1 hypothetical protein [Escherichia coli]EKE9456374.1 hypothetical protein [Escherichia coli]EKF1852919.1 hypothetical protein [Escherichia coli]